MNRSQTRELAFKLLYQIEIQKEINDEDNFGRSQKIYKRHSKWHK